MHGVIESFLLGLVIALGMKAFPRVREYDRKWALYPICLVLLWVSSGISLAFVRNGWLTEAIAYGLVALWFLRHVLGILKTTQESIDREWARRNREYDRLCEEDSTR